MNRSCPILVIAVLCSVTPSGFAKETAFLEEGHRVGGVYHVSSRSDLSGKLTPPAQPGKPAPRPIEIRGDSAFEYDERIVSISRDGFANKTVRYCQKMSVQRQVGGQPQKNSLRDGVRRLVVLRENRTKAPFSPDGPLLWTEIDLVRTDLFVPLLLGMLPNARVETGQSWNMAESAALELTGFDSITKGTLRCKFVEVALMDRRRKAHVKLSGTLEGINEDGPLTQEITGYFLFDLEEKYLAYLYIRGTHLLKDKNGREMGKISGRFVLERSLQPKSDRLTSQALRGANLEPTSESTQLLYDNRDLGVRFLYPRQWRIASVEGQQLTLETSTRMGLLMTLEPLSKTPTIEQYRQEAHKHSREQNIRILGASPPKTLRASPLLQTCEFQIYSKERKSIMQYFVTKQQLGGAVIAARLPSSATDTMKKEVRELVWSVRITNRIGR